jgi:undecaprenyl-diphosphatase
VRRSRRKPRPVELELIAGGLGVLAATTALARRNALHQREHDVFRNINELPSTIFPPVFVVMQAGSLGAVFVVGALAYKFAGPRTAAELVAAGFGTWLGAKGVKRVVQRGRPAAHFPDVNVRGPAERGLGFPSGHAGVSTAMATVAAGAVPPPWSAVGFAIAPVVGFGRVYVGAHLPLDIVGGAALGVTLGAAARLVGRAIAP